VKVKESERIVRTIVPPVRAVHPQEYIVFFRDLTHEIEGADRGQQFLIGVKRERGE
jgi:hypothetical protein